MKNETPVILVVEDDAVLLSALVEKLNRFEFKTLECKDGEAGLALALKEKPDLILLDIVMPKMDGVMLLRKLREEGGMWGKEVPVIFLTNLDASDERRMQEVLAFEPAYYLVKSNIKLEDVIDKVKERLSLPVA